MKTSVYIKGLINVIEALKYDEAIIGQAQDPDG